MAMFPSYSPLFTMGLLAERAPIAAASSSCSPAPSPVEPSPKSPSAIYFTLHTDKRDTAELRSFLYLDLADHKHLAPSHRRKHSVLSKSTSWTCITDAASTHAFAPTEKPTITLSPTPLTTRRQTSKESMRSIPSPKPAPSATLPDLPVSPISPSPLSASPRKRPASTFIMSPVSPTFSRRSASLYSESLYSQTCRKSRMDALACLEGRSRTPRRVLRASTLRNNFMSFSDNEDEQKPAVSKAAVVPAEDASAFADVEDEVDVIVPVVQKRDHRTQAVRPTKPARPRRSTVESWFPLKSFIDLKDDDLVSWNWRSFIEIGGVA